MTGDAQTTPKAGESWQLPSEATPWGPKTYSPVKILDVRDGWVRYDMGGVFRDERMKLDAFMQYYRKYQQ